MSRWLAAMAWDFRLQWRYGFFLVGAIVAATAVGVLLPFPVAAETYSFWLPVFVLGNLTVTTFYFVAGLVMFEKGEGTLEALVVTPISPQGLSNRPLVLHTDDELSLSVSVSTGVTTLAIDGQAYHPLRQGQLVRLRRHPEPYPLLAMPGLDPYRRLRERLGWRGSVEPDVFRSDR